MASRRAAARLAPVSLGSDDHARRHTRPGRPIRRLRGRTRCKQSPGARQGDGQSHCEDRCSGRASRHGRSHRECAGGALRDQACAGDGRRLEDRQYGIPLSGDSSRVAFTESTFLLATDSNSPSVARSMLDLAQVRDWKGLRVSGAKDFRRLVWLEATMRSVKAIGYEPNPADLELLRREREDRQTNRIEPTRDLGSSDATAPHEKSSARSGGRKAVVAAIDAVLIAKNVPQAKRQAVLAAATEQLARSATMPKIKVYDRSAERQMQIPPPAPDFNRGQDRVAPTRAR
ncbi:hypothetical protein PEC18_21010 [Paucibacter sp. O1-1]|nr:hypothetical protein [Paucibacter sp. O1-1]MDA3828234.1 hypothetical protein [Paucibacter sp. O1-1]